METFKKMFGRKKTTTPKQEVERRNKKQVGIQATPLPLQNGQVAIVLDNVLTKKECLEWIQRAEDQGYEAAEINAGGILVGGGTRSYYNPNYRNSDRCIIDDEVRAAELFKRMQPYLPQVFERPLRGQGKRMSSSPLAGLNERLRFLKYGKGGFFRPHFDGIYCRPDGSAMSAMTVMLYLNDGEADFQGGRACLLRQSKIADEEPTILHPVVPKAGRVLIFDHDICHVGEEVLTGTKLCVRTDVLFNI
jgi:hypothetical protein